MLGAAGSPETLVNLTKLHGTTSLKKALTIFLEKTS